jgi:hypothetical protein
MTAGNARGTTVVILTVAIPTLLISLFLAARGSLRAQLVRMGALFYLLYNAVFFAFDAAFNPLFLLYTATLSLAVWRSWRCCSASTPKTCARISWAVSRFAPSQGICW